MNAISSSKLDEFRHIFSDMKHIKEIDHIEDGFFGFLVESVPNYDFSGVAIIEDRMAISFGVFDVLYPPCKKIVLKSQTLTDSEFQENLEVINLSTKIILCLNGEMNSAVNRRLRMLQLGLIKNIEGELHFVELISCKFKKAGILWFWRQNLIKKYFETKKASKECIVQILEQENQMLENFFMKYPRNYYGWGYKKFLIQEFILKNEYSDLLWYEYSQIKLYCERHIHDYCAFHHLGCLAIKLDCKEPEKKVKEQEVLWAHNLIKKYEDLYILEQLEIPDKGIKYHKLESIRNFLKIIER